MIAFIDDYREVHGVEPICKVLPIAPSTYHDHLAKRADPAKLSARATRDQALRPEIARVFAENFEVYGARKVWRQMLREGFAVARCTVERLMQEMGLQGVIRGKPVRTTVQDKAAPCPLDHVNRVPTTVGPPPAADTSLQRSELAKSATSGLTRRSEEQSLFDHVVGAGEPARVVPPAQAP